MTNILGNRTFVDSNNFAGLSRTDVWDGTFPQNPDFRNDGMREGVRAHIQHLRAYASTTVNRQQIVSPRIHLLSNVRGRVTTFDQLYERWSSNPSYKTNIEALLTGLYNFL